MHGTSVPVEEPSTASEAVICRARSLEVLPAVPQDDVTSIAGNPSACWRAFKAARARYPLSQLILKSSEHHRQSRFIDGGRRHVLAAAPGLANRRVACKPGRFSDALK